ncbi:ECF RNA polymerase sigma-E factor [Planctomycetes bacterium Poly30]|uniref:RNA polymerase sigma factor n=1 Tax=Saltatorellus ferox TaxID=2528018 RepID=A0A518EXZ7_9BACT|nr:ECF RNA polymerase sigma-E factor [Planctomycetes bacterium Poly30]
MQPPTTWTTEDLLHHHGWARSLARHLVADEATADDVVQESMILALQRAPRGFEGAGARRSWLGSVVRNVVRQRGRAEGRRAYREREAAPAEALPSALEMTTFAEGQKLLLSALLTLDEDSRHLVLLRYHEGLSAAEIARRSDRSAGTVRSKIKRALDHLREELDRKHGGDRSAWLAAVAPLGWSGSGLGLPAPGVDAATASAKGLSWGMKWVAGLLLASVALVAFVLLGSPDKLFERRVAPPLLSASEVADLDRSVGSTEADIGAGFTLAEPGAPGRSGEADRVGLVEESPEVSAAAPVEPDSMIGTFRVRVVDEEARPVEGAEVSARTGKPVLSGADGRAEIDVFLGSPFLDATLVVRHFGHAADRMNVKGARGEATDVGDFVLRPGGDLAGRVVNPRGEPMPGLTVSTEGQMRRVSSGGGISSFSGTGLGRTEARTDDLGRFRLRGVLAGEVDVQVESDDGIWTGGLSSQRAAPGELLDNVVITVEEIPVETRIEGVVLDSEGAPAPYAGIRLEWSRFFSNSSSARVTNGEGRFVVVVPKGVSVDMWFTERSGGLPGAFRGDVAAGTLDMVVSLAPPASFRIVVKGRGGEPVADAQVGVMVSDSLGTYGRTDSDGMIELARPLAEFLLTIEGNGYADFSQDYEALPIDPDVPAVLPIQLRPIPQLTGTVKAGGQPVEGARLSVREIASGKVEIVGLPSLVDTDTKATGVTDEAGGFALTPQARGRFVLRAEGEGYAAAEFGPFDYDENEGLTGVELALTPGGAVEGRVFDGDTLRQEYVVLLSRGDGLVRTVRTDLDGDYRFDHVTPGPCFLRVVPEMIPTGIGSSMSTWGRPYRTIEGDARVMEGAVTRHDIAVGGALPRARLRGRLDLKGFDPTRLRASLNASESGLQDGSYEAEVRVGVDGTFELPAGLPGSYLLLLTDAASGEDTTALRMAIPVVLGAGTNDRDLTLGFGEIRTGPSADPETESLLWRGGGGAFAIAPLPPEGSTRPFPAGSVSRVSTLEVMVQQSLQDFDGIDALEDLTLGAGEVATTGR